MARRAKSHRVAGAAGVVVGVLSALLLAPTGVPAKIGEQSPDDAASFLGRAREALAYGDIQRCIEEYLMPAVADAQERGDAKGALGSAVIAFRQSERLISYAFGSIGNLYEAAEIRAFRRAIDTPYHDEDRKTS